MDLAPGLSGQAVLVVGAADTAAALGSGDVDVLGTPRVVALCEEATVAAVRAALGDDETSVGVRIELEHLLPSVPGATVTAVATLDEVDRRRLRFSVEVTQDGQVVARGTVERAVVSRSRFAAPSTTSE